MKRKMLRNNLHSGLHGLLLVVVGMMMLSLLSCGGKVPKKYIQPSEMENILYDYHMLQSMRNVLDIDSQMQKAYLQTLFDKYDVTQADFDSSMVFYLRHTDMLHAMYERLSERIEKEAIAQGADGIGGFDFSGGDTANVWRMERAHVFDGRPPYNVMQFSVPVDTAFKAGDRLILSFATDFLIESGQRSGIAVLSVKLKNDSVITRTQMLSGVSRQQMEVSDNDRVGIKSIEGFFLQKESSSSMDRTSTSVRMMIISDIKLIRMHTKEVPKVEEVKADSTDVARPDTINPQPGVTPPPTDNPKDYGPENTPAPNPAGGPKAPIKPMRPAEAAKVQPIRGNARNNSAPQQK